MLVEGLDNLPGFDALGATLENAARLQKGGRRPSPMTRRYAPCRQSPAGGGQRGGHGMSMRGAGLRAVTIVPARMWGIEDRNGSIGAGKDADVVIWVGDPFEVTTVGGCRVHPRARDADAETGRPSSATGTARRRAGPPSCRDAVPGGPAGRGGPAGPGGVPEAVGYRAGLPSTSRMTIRPASARAGRPRSCAFADQTMLRRGPAARARGGVQGHRGSPVASPPPAAARMAADRPQIRRPDPPPGRATRTAGRTPRTLGAARPRARPP